MTINRLKILAPLLILVYMLTSCVTSRDTNLLQNIEQNYPKVKPENYQLIPGDQLSIVIYAIDKETQSQFSGFAPRYAFAGQNNATQTSSDVARQYDNTNYNGTPINIYADGTINFPYLGKLYVQGMTIFEVRKLMSDKLEAFAEGTTADVNLSNRYFSVLGEAGAQRYYMTNTTMTIYEALATSNSISDYGNRAKVSIIRQTEDGSILRTFDLRSKDVIDSEYYYIQPNDVIYFPQMKKRFFGGTDSFAGTISLVSLFIGIMVYAARLF